MSKTSVVDIITDQDEKKSHSIEFVLWPRKWQEFQIQLGLPWEICRLSRSCRSMVPESPGIYTLVIQPMLFGHPACSYLMYVGQAVNLRQRFGKYLTTERRETGRPKVMRLLNKWPDNLWFCYTLVSTNELDLVEKTLMMAYIPPCNDQFPAELSKVTGAF